jgi:rhodanese-related sulfurtransferase
MSQHTPSPGAKSITQVLEDARSQLIRLTPQQLHKEFQLTRPVHIIDIRPAAQRELEGPFSIDQITNDDLKPKFPEHRVHVIERNVLEWRLDPQSEARLEEVMEEKGYETRLVVVCSEGYTSSLAAKALKELGLGEATDLEGGVRGWNGFLATDRAEAS